jgi:hypothetical protein
MRPAVLHWLRSHGSLSQWHDRGTSYTGTDSARTARSLRSHGSLSQWHDRGTSYTGTQ